jgi:hypothetical protein
VQIENVSCNFSNTTLQSRFEDSSCNNNYAFSASQLVCNSRYSIQLKFLCHKKNALNHSQTRQCGSKVSVLPTSQCGNNLQHVQSYGLYSTHVWVVFGKPKISWSLLQALISENQISYWISDINSMTTKKERSWI